MSSRRQAARPFRTQRVRDPVHGLIVFRQGEPVDELAWRLINTSEFQRLRRIKQLGVSEFIFPGATHTRFSHCIGVFDTARMLIEIVKREIDSISEVFDDGKAEVAIIAALLHDLGHGPLSHTFEEVRKSQGITKRHEEWTAEIVLNPKGEICKLLKGFRPERKFHKAVADLLASEDPKNIYHAIVSSSFDADRLDYLRRDKLMTGTGAGAIDIDWLREHVRVAIVNLEAAEVDPDEESEIDEAVPHAPTFCIDIKALPAAEQFLLSRYTLHEQVYFHKTTRCIEHMIGALLTEVAACATRSKKISSADSGLPADHPLLRFFGQDGATVENYLALDDVVLLGALERMEEAKSPKIADLAKRLRERNLYKTLDVRSAGVDEGKQRLLARQIDRKIKERKFSGIVLKDDKASLSIYSQIGGDDEKAHKKLRILDADGRPKEISKLSKIIELLASKRLLTRYYFENESDRALAARR